MHLVEVESRETDFQLRPHKCGCTVQAVIREVIVGISKRVQQANIAREEPATSTNAFWGSLEKRGSTKAQLKAPSRSSRGPARLSGKRDQYPCLARILDLRAEPRNADICMDAAVT